MKKAIASKEVPTVSRQLKDYLRGAPFKKQVVRAYQRYEVLAEGALRTLVVRLLRSKLRRIGSTAANRYRVTCEDYLPDDRVRPDILIWRGKNPRFWIELKDLRVFVARAAKADWKKLRKYCKKYKSVKAGFLIYVARTGSANFPIVRSKKTLRLWPVSIKLKDYLDDFDRWNREYKRRAQYRRLSQRPKP